MNIHYIKSWKQFKKLAEEPNGPYLFRGQANENWDLSSPLTRIINNYCIDHVLAVEIEKKALSWVQKSLKDKDGVWNKIESTNALAWWEIMQQYGLRTFLLDWSKSPYVALYFSVRSHPKARGAFFVADVGHLQWIQSIRSREDENKPQLNTLTQIEKSINFKKHDKAMAIIKSPNPTIRMTAQSSSFSILTNKFESHDIAGDDIVFGRIGNPPEEKYSIFDKYIIQNNLKQNFLSRLNEIDINESTLFPDTSIIDEYKKEFDLFIKALLDQYNSNKR